MRYLGDWEEEPIKYGGVEVGLVHLLAGLRDGEGKLHVVRIAYDSFDLEPRHMTGLWCLYDGQSSLSPLSGDRHLFFLEKLPEWFRVGEEIGIKIPEKNYFEVGSIFPVNPNVPKEWNNAQTVMLLTLFNTQSNNYSLSAFERSALDQYQWPDRMVTLAPTSGVGVRRASEQDCEP